MLNKSVRVLAAAGAVSVAAACSDRVDPRDDDQPAIPPGVSVQPQRSAPATGGLQVTGQDSAAAPSAAPGPAFGDTTPGARS